MKKVLSVAMMGMLAIGTASAECAGPSAPAAVAENAKGGFVGGAETIVTIESADIQK